MASPEQVREYLAHWFQLGKPVVLENGKAECLPYPIFVGSRYSQAFEECWQQILHKEGSDCYLKGTDQTIATLLSPAWEVVSCARCSLPIPLPDMGYSPYPCPCHDLTIWPNDEIPKPRMGVDTNQHLSVLQSRLAQVQGVDQPATRPSYDPADAAKIAASWRSTS
ncbi:hypothetical protein [Pseudanabaena sp. FACHB-2040]|uniref:hypothetical protein n=1 Tax=Pseudanabaena sp. FACHB-2040 TaxID=2692859 RepID=UPI0018EF9532|nr:hypothetical protein [Pseudanabaena sp. FACHB-2040]